MTKVATAQDRSYDEMRRYVESETGISLGDEKRYLLETRLAPVMRSEECRDWAELLQRARGDATRRIRDLIVDAMTTNETLWFRDGGPFEILRNKLLPRWADEIRRGKREKVRVWCAACSTGQEPYSVMITAQEYARTQSALGSDDVEILATDISDTALTEARLGCYNSVAMSRGLGREIRDRYFREKGRSWEIMPEVRRGVTFAKRNLQDSFALLGTFDLVMLRYVAIYFSDDFKRELYGRLRSALAPGGVLMLGSSESLEGYSSDYVSLRQGRTVYYQTASAAPLASSASPPPPAPAAPAAPTPKSAPPVAAPGAAPGSSPGTGVDLNEVLAMLRSMNEKYSR